MLALDCKINPLLYNAIAGRRMLRLFYKQRERIVEPHDYGIHNGRAKLLVYQVGGSSSQKLPNWRWIEERDIQAIEVLDQTFPGGRASAEGRHHRWDKLFIRVEPATRSVRSAGGTL